jgi:hypothetical protein
MHRLLYVVCFFILVRGDLQLKLFLHCFYFDVSVVFFKND